MENLTSPPIDFRKALRDIGLSQSGFARTLVAWGDPRPFDVVLRWVQRAVAGQEPGPYPGVIIGIFQRHIRDRETKRRTLRLLESGNMRSFRNMGAGEEDTTALNINETKRQIEEIDKLIYECKLNNSMPVISVDEININDLRRFQRIYVVSDEDYDSMYLIWDSHRLLPFVSKDTQGTLIEDAMIYVESIEIEALQPVYSAIIAAGGERGMIRI